MEQETTNNHSSNKECGFGETVGVLVEERRERVKLEAVDDGAAHNDEQPHFCEAGTLNNEPDELNVKGEEDSTSSTCIDGSLSIVDVQSQSTSENLFDAFTEDCLQGIVDLKNEHAKEVSAAKRKQWCFNCEEEATESFHCCWNTAYCSSECQEEHWGKEHKRVCRRWK